MADIADVNKNNAQEYDASQIQVLEGLEAVRKRPGMYIGSTSSSGLHHLVYEIVDNSIDEALAGFCTHINVTIEQGDIIRVEDNGRGIPVDIQEQTGKSALEVVFTVLHAGGKFGGGGYKVSGGLHGVGASVVNALSEWLEVEVCKDGQRYGMKFSRGDIVEYITKLGPTDKRGTTVRFKPDPEMFDDTVYDYEILHTRMREQAFLNGGLTITLRDEREGKEQGKSSATRAAYANSSHTSITIKIPSMRMLYTSPARRATQSRRSRCNTTTGTAKPWFPSRTTYTHQRAACTRRASKPRSHV